MTEGVCLRTEFLRLLGCHWSGRITWTYIRYSSRVAHLNSVSIVVWSHELSTARVRWEEQFQKKFSVLTQTDSTKVTKDCRSIEKSTYGVSFVRKLSNYCMRMSKSISKYLPLRSAFWTSFYTLFYTYCSQSSARIIVTDRTRGTKTVQWGFKRGAEARVLHVAVKAKVI